MLEDEANEPHHAEYEAARAELEDQQQQLQDTIKELKAAILYVSKLQGHMIQS